ncbi:hypothetical protein [Actinospica robiniae]|uniref:hypothetical protein n=1 Tax=Actinospica robiniae TaxID=304901 RepID=UPI0003F5EE25|nr:hypothetical protein [Actinospica robiniae]
MSDGTLAEPVWDNAPGQIPRHPLRAVLAAPGRAVAPIEACRQCGAAVGEKVFALCCASCAQPLTLDSDLTEPARPDALALFALDEAGARTALRAWIAHRRLAPKSFKAAAAVRSLDGVYLPFWAFSASTRTNYVGRRGVHKSRSVYRTHTNSEGQSEGSWETERYTDWDHTAGQVVRYFDGVRVPACTPLPDKVPDWPLAALAPYAQGATEGRRIIAYDLEPGQGFVQATYLMGEQIERDVRADIGGDEQRIKEVATDYADESCTLLLLPAWLVTYAHATRTFSALVNGSTGEVAGDRPYSRTKISVLIGAIVLVAAVVILLLRP